MSDSRNRSLLWCLRALGLALAMGLVGCSDPDVAERAQLDATFAMDAATADASVLPPPSLALDAALVRYEKLIDNQSWSRYDAGLDPLASHQPAQIVCPESGTYLEYGSYEVDSTRCNYLLAEHPALRALPAGSRVRISLLHYDLLAPEPAQAHVALLFGDALQWETFIPIPSPGDAIKETFVTNAALTLEQPVRLHLHNHGGNTYLLVALEAALALD